MKVCPSCDSAAVTVAKNKPDECRRCGHTGLFHHLHGQTSGRNHGLYLSPGGYQKLKKPTAPN